MTGNLCVMLQLCAVFIESRSDMRVKYALMVIAMMAMALSTELVVHCNCRID